MSSVGPGTVLQNTHFLRDFFRQKIFKVFIEFVTILLPFSALAFCLQGV